MIVREIARRLAPYARDLRIVDYGLCLLAAYVVVEGPDGRQAFGAAHIPHEDIHRVGRVLPPELAALERFVVDPHPLNRVLGLAMANAVSQYHYPPVRRADSDVLIQRLVAYPDPICLVGNMSPLDHLLRERGKDVWVFERSQLLKGPFSFSDIEEPLLLPRCGAAVITGMTLNNFTVDRVLELVSGYRVLAGPSASILPQVLEGLGFDALFSMTYSSVDAPLHHVKLGGFLSPAIHVDLGTPFFWEFSD